MKTQLIHQATKHWCHSNNGELCEYSLDSEYSHKLPYPSLQFPKHFSYSRHAMHILICPQNLPLVHGL